MLSYFASLLVVTLFAHGIFSQNSCEINRLKAVKSGQQKVRGTNLGNWFILESWMKPSLWQDNKCDQTKQDGTYLLEKCLGTKANSIMDKHWSTWITEADFVDMSKNGVNVARLPVGWWQIYDTEGGADKAKLNYTISPRDYTTGALAYIDKAFEWGKKHGIAILLGMHSAPGSQSCNAHSSPTEYPHQTNWDKSVGNVGQTIDSMRLYAQRYGKHEALYGFYLLNGPAHINISVLQEYYKRAYSAVRDSSPDSYIITNPLMAPFESGTESYWTSFMNPDQGFKKVAMDIHYWCYGGEGGKRDVNTAINYINKNRKDSIADFTKKNPKLLLIGEWSNCGRFDNSRAPDFAKAQVNIYNSASMGWTFWSWTNGKPGNPWSFKTALNSNWIDKPYPC